MRIPEETRVAVQTEQAARQLAGVSVPSATSTANVAHDTPAATALPEQTIPATETATPVSSTVEPTVSVPTATIIANPVPQSVSTLETVPPEGTEYVVQRGDNLVKIARKYGLQVQDLVAANNLANPSMIYWGQVLRIPGSEEIARMTTTPVMAVPTEATIPAVAVTTTVPTATPIPTGPVSSPEGEVVEYVVRPGDYLIAIAQQFGVSTQAIAEANGLWNWSDIKVGQVLRIPLKEGQSPTNQNPTVTQPDATTPVPATAGQANTGGAGKIAFQVASGGDIYVVRADGTGLRRLTAGLDPAWSPDGSMLAFARWTEPRGLYLIDADGSEERLILQRNQLKSPTWSPDGSRIAFTREEPGSPGEQLCFPGFGCFEIPPQSHWRLGVVGVDGSGFDDLPADLQSHAPDWSRSGWLAYQGERGLRATETDGAPWFIIEDVSAAFPAVSPDGSRIALMYRQHDHWEIFSVNADGTGLRPLTQADPLASVKANNVAPAWSPDGNSILFLSDRDGRWRPYVMSADGSEQQPFLPQVFDSFNFRYDFAAERVFSWSG